MNDLPDLELHKTPGEPSLPTRSPTRPVALWVAVARLIVAAGAAAYFAFAWRTRPAPMSAAPAPTAATKEPLRPLGGKAEPITLPPLDASDALVRTLVRALSENSAVAAWLATDGLIRN